MTRVASTVSEYVQRQWGDGRRGLRYGGLELTHHQVAAGSAARAALLAELLPRGVEPHLGVLLDNTPEFPLWLGAAALAGAAVAGINPTRRGPELARDILHTECRVLVTGRVHLPLLDGLHLPGVRVLVTGTEEYERLLAPYEGARPGECAVGPVGPATRLLLYFTSGSTGAPKAAICTQGRLAAAGEALVSHFGLGPDEVHYICMPMFHGNAVIANWAPALTSGATVALRERFSASGFLDDVRAYGATYFTYVGRAVHYVLATPARPEDREHRLRIGFGTEAGAVDADRFARRFGVELVEGYGSSEGGAAIQRTPGTPPGAIGRPAPGGDLAVVDPETGRECERARFDEAGRLLNGGRAVGELVNRGPNPFEGYWRNPAGDAERRRGGWYWTGDLFFRDEDGFLYFAARADDRLRVDSENLAAALIENILARWEPVTGAAVYAVPDPVTGDQVMAALSLPDAPFDPAAFLAFLSAQRDLGTKMAPRFVRVMPRLPVTATNKVHRAVLREEGFWSPGEVWWRPPGEAAYRPLSPVDLTRLREEYAAHGRAAVLGAQADGGRAGRPEGAGPGGPGHASG
ncbi:AMP-binding protein [Streptomyces sp. NPDC001205]